jgi:putative Mg2+ transporter-C (MgtC) family protein
MTVIQILVRMLLAAACSAVIGFERESAQKDAGLRTHMLVGVGAAMFTIVGIIGFDGDPSRVAAQIVTGIGFLGAGAIFKEGATVKGLTTAAGLWAVAAVGMAAGAGAIAVAVAGTTMVAIVFVAFRKADEVVARRKLRMPDQIEVNLDNTKRLEPVLKFARRIDETVQQLSFKRVGDKGGVLIISVRPETAAMLCEMLSSHKGVSSAEQLRPLFWEHPGKD